MSWFPKKNVINFSSLKYFYHRLANRKDLILSQEKYFKTLKGMVTGSVSTKLFFFELFTIFQNGWNNETSEIWAFNIARAISR